METQKKIWLVYQNWNDSGDTITNDVLGVFKSLRGAKKCLVETLADEFNNHDYENVVLTPDTKGLKDVNLKELANMFADDAEFDTDLTDVECWDGERDWTEKYFEVWIEERELQD